MNIKDLPKAGLGFKALYSKAGAPSLKKALNKLAIKNSAFRNLSKSNVVTIANVIKPAEKSIRLKGGMSRYQVKSATKKLWRAYKTTKGTENEFSKQDIKDGKEILGAYKKSFDKKTEKKDGVKKVIPFRPYLNQEAAPRVGITSISSLNQNVQSIQSFNNRNVTNVKNENNHNAVNASSLLNPTHSVSMGSAPIVSRPTILSSLSSFFGKNKPGSSLKF